MKLEQLLEGVSYTLVQGSLELDIEDIIYDSRKAAPGRLFVCIVGTQRDSHDYAAQCVANGVTALVVQHDIDLSALPDLIGGFVLGPVGAVEIIAVKVLLKLVFKGTSSMFTGEIQKFLLCTAYALPAVQALHRAGVINGMPDGSFQPFGTATREQACVVLCAL